MFQMDSSQDSMAGMKTYTQVCGQHRYVIDTDGVVNVKKMIKGLEITKVMQQKKMQRDLGALFVRRSEIEAAHANDPSWISDGPHKNMLKDIQDQIDEIQEALE